MTFRAEVQDRLKTTSAKDIKTEDLDKVILATLYALEARLRDEPVIP